jgi:hypothetical protein
MARWRQLAAERDRELAALAAAESQGTPPAIEAGQKIA